MMGSKNWCTANCCYRWFWHSECLHRVKGHARAVEQQIWPEVELIAIGGRWSSCHSLTKISFWVSYYYPKYWMNSLISLDAFFPQCAVRAATQGRVLVLEGLEKAERNVLPVLNNLLENREMQLEDGRFLMSAERYDKLLQVREEHLPNNMIMGDWRSSWYINYKTKLYSNNDNDNNNHNDDNHSNYNVNDSKKASQQIISQQGSKSEKLIKLSRQRE